jgi:CRISPR system Cascade subunit CasB
MTDTAAPAPSAPPSRAELHIAVGITASTLQAQYLGHRGERQQTAARARLAELRRNAGFTPEQRPLALQEVLDALHPGLREEDLGKGDAPSRTERAAFDAMTLFALHMQSADRPVHVRGLSFGAAVGLLYIGTKSESLKPRFDALLAARHERSRLTHARSLITLLRGAGIGFDYGSFARDLRTLAGEHRAGVLLRWGRDFAMTPRRKAEESASDASDAAADS